MNEVLNASNVQFNSSPHLLLVSGQLGLDSLKDPSLFPDSTEINKTALTVTKLRYQLLLRGASQLEVSRHQKQSSETSNP